MKKTKKGKEWDLEAKWRKRTNTIDQDKLGKVIFDDWESLVEEGATIEQCIEIFNQFPQQRGVVEFRLRNRKTNEIILCDIL